MDVLHVIVLAVVQGLTEFLPVSSSGHLVLVPHLWGWQDQGLAFDVAVHVGTLVAVIAYFWRDLRQIASSSVQAPLTKQWNADARLGWGIALATVPVVVAGVLLGEWIEAHLRSVLIVAMATIVFGLVLGWADHVGSGKKNMADASWRDLWWIGVVQVLALIPGSSRSGVTMSAAQLLGYDRDAAARVSFLLSIPTIAGAGLMLAMRLFTSGQPIAWSMLALSAVVSAAVAWACIRWFLAFVRRCSLKVFVVYRLILGAVLLWVFWSV